jgi:hypothetical protein
MSLRVPDSQDVCFNLFALSHRFYLRLVDLVYSIILNIGRLYWFVKQNSLHNQTLRNISYQPLNPLSPINSQLSVGPDRCQASGMVSGCGQGAQDMSFLIGRPQGGWSGFEARVANAKSLLHLHTGSEMVLDISCGTCLRNASVSVLRREIQDFGGVVGVR